MFSGSEEKHFSISEIKETLQIIDAHVEEEKKYWLEQKEESEVYKRIFVGGFSQGCAVSLLYALTTDKILAGAVGWSGHLFQSFELRNVGKIPLLINHGEYDSMIPFEMGRKSYEGIMK